MRIGLVTTFQYPCPPVGWGAEGYIWDLCCGLNELGHEVYLFAKEGSKVPSLGKLIVCDDEIEITSNEYTKHFKSCDIIHDFSGTKLVHDCCQRFGINSIATNFNTHFLYPRIHKNIVTISDRQRYLGMAGKSGFEYTPWENTVGYTGHLHDAKRVYIGINTDKYTYKKDKDDYILWFNGFDYRKGILVAIEMAKQMGFKLKIAGDVRSHQEHIKTFNEVKPIIDLVPNIEYIEMPYNESEEKLKIELFQNAKAYLFPVLFEQPFAVVVIEALSCGTPVLTFNHGAMPELIHHGETGFLCNTIDELCNSVNNVDKINTLMCRNDAVKRFDYEVMAKEYIKLYEEIIDGGGW